MKVVIVSGFFNPLHGGHLDYLEGAAKMGDRLVVIVNNDNQQLLKKGKIMLALRNVDDVILAVDKEPPVIETLKLVADKYKEEELIFANGGDRSSDKVVPETEICHKLGIEMKFGVGGVEKADSSTRINQATNKEK